MIPIAVLKMPLVLSCLPVTNHWWSAGVLHHLS